VRLGEFNVDWTTEFNFCADTQPRANYPDDGDYDEDEEAPHPNNANMAERREVIKALHSEAHPKKQLPTEDPEKFHAGSINYNAKYIAAVPRPTRTLLECPESMVKRKKCPASNRRYPSAFTVEFPYYRVWDTAQEWRKKEPPGPNKYYFSIIAIFKNEALVMKECT